MYEALLCKPTQVLAELCQLMEVQFDASMVEPYESDAPASFQPAQRQAITDPKLLRRKKIEAAQAGKWRRVKLPQPLRDETATLARAFGYLLSQ